jgi:hypothetical protein
MSGDSTTPISMLQLVVMDTNDCIAADSLIEVTTVLALTKETDLSIAKVVLEQKLYACSLILFWVIYMPALIVMWKLLERAISTVKF